MTLTKVTYSMIQGSAFNVLDFGAVGDGVTDNYQAFQDAIDALPVSGGTIIIPATAKNEWYISQTLNVRKKAHIIGQIAQATGTSGTILYFPADVSGIVFNSSNTSLYQTVAVDPLLPGAYGSILENVALFGDKAGSVANADGVVLRCGAECRGVSVRNFKRYGFRIHATIGGGGDIEGDANQWTLYRCQTVQNGSHGVYAAGNDANVGVATKVFSFLNTGYGFYDDSLIGNTYVGCDTVGNTAGVFWSDRASSYGTVIGHWEDGSGVSSFGSFWTILGGKSGAFLSNSNGFNCVGGLATQAPHRYLNARGSEQVESSLGAPLSITSPTALTFGSIDSETASAWKLTYEPTEKRWFLWYANSGFFIPISFINSDNDLYTQQDFTGPVFQNGYAVKIAGQAIGASFVRAIGTSAPSTGTWKRGDIVYNTTPNAGDYVGWICITSGTPGTWKTFGAISA